MIIHRAETGQTFPHPTPLHSAILAPDFHAFLAALTGVPDPANVLALLSSGEAVRSAAQEGEEALGEVAGRLRGRRASAGGGDGDGNGAAGEEEVWVFDLGLMGGDDMDGMGALDLGGMEEPEVRETAYAAPTPSSYLPPAQTHHAHLTALLSSLSTQQRALALAHSTLLTHLTNLSSALAAFAPLAQRSLSVQRSLLASHPLAIRVIARVRVHPELRRMGVARWGKGRETLGDFVNAERMALVERQCGDVFVQLAGRWREVRAREAELRAGADRARTAIDGLVPKEAEECYHRATRALTRLQQVISDTTDEPPETDEAYAEREQVMAELRTLDHSIRLDLRQLTSLKLASTQTTLSTLRLISSLQSSISVLPPVLKALEHALRANSLSSSSSGLGSSSSSGLVGGGAVEVAPGGAGFGHLMRVRKGLYAYAATVVEVVRRKEFARFFHARAKGLGELMHKLTAKEHKRRQAYRAECLGQLPFEVRGLGADDPVPTLELTVLGAGEGEWVLSRADVDGVMELVREMERVPWPDAGARGAVYEEFQFDVGGSDGGEGEVERRVHPATEARLALEKMIERMQGLEEGFDRLAERSLLSSSWAPSASKHRARTASDVSGFREALDELRELKRAKSEVQEQRAADRDALADELTALQAELTLAQAQGDEQRARAERAEGELRSVRASAESDRSVRQTLERRHAELRADLAHKAHQLESVLGEGTAQTEEMEALRKELLHAREEFERVRALQEESAGEAGKLLRAQAEMLRELEEARKRGEDLEIRIEQARMEGQKASEALTEASMEKDRLLRQQASDAERRLRDQRAEADGDRAVLERHYYELTAKVETLEAELQEVRGREEVERADLEEARERLRNVEGDRGEWQRDKEEWETARVRWMERESALQEIVAVALGYRDTCGKLINAVQASNFIARLPNGELGAAPAPPSKQPQPAQLQFPPVDPSDIPSALSALRSFPLAAFSDAVLKTGSTIRRWQKNTREYRDRAKGRISYRSFAKGDLALFLPTRNNVAKPWAAFNVGFPHYFLDQGRGVANALEGRDWLVARITAIRECVADSKDPASNPYSLVDGLKYHMLEVELVNLTAPDPSSRRKTSLSASRSIDGNNSMTADSMMASMVASSPSRPSVPDIASVPPPASPPSPQIMHRPPHLTKNFTQPFVPLLAREEPVPSPFSPSLSSDTPIGEPASHVHDFPTIPESESEQDSVPTPPQGIPFTAPHLSVPASTQHTQITEADIIDPTSPTMHSKGTPIPSQRGSFSSHRGRPFLGPSLSSSPSGKAIATTALMRASTPVEPPQTPSPAESFGAAALDAARRMPPSSSPSTGQSAFATIASNFGATWGRKRTPSTVATSPSQGLGVPTAERREVSGGAADLLKRFSRV